MGRRRLVDRKRTRNDDRERRQREHDRLLIRGLFPKKIDLDRGKLQRARFERVDRPLRTPSPVRGIAGNRKIGLDLPFSNGEGIEFVDFGRSFDAPVRLRDDLALDQDRFSGAH